MREAQLLRSHLTVEEGYLRIDRNRANHLLNKYQRITLWVAERMRLFASLSAGAATRSGMARLASIVAPLGNGESRQSICPHVR